MRSIYIGMGLGFGGGKTNPHTVPNLVLELYSHLGVTLTSSKVTAWADQSGAGNSFTSAGTGCQFNATDAAVNNMPSLGGSSNADWLVGPTPAAIIGSASEAEAFFVVQAFSQTGNNARLTRGFGAHNATGDGQLITFGGTCFDDFYGNAGGGETRFTGYSFGTISGLQAPVVYNVNSKANAWNAIVNGTSKLSAGTNTFTKGATAATLLGTSGATLYQGRLSAVLIYARVLNASERTGVTSFLTNLYRIS